MGDERVRLTEATERASRRSDRSSASPRHSVCSGGAGNSDRLSLTTPDVILAAGCASRSTRSSSPDRPIFYRSANAPGIPALYLHGVPTSSDDWSGFLARTGGLAPDLIGFGRSGKAGNLEYTIDGLADFVERFLDHLAVPRVQLVAHDWGAAAGLVFAQRHPGRIARIVLLNALPLLDGFRWHRLARLWRTPVIGELAMGSTSRWLLRRSMRAGAVNPDAWPREQVAAV